MLQVNISSVDEAVVIGAALSVFFRFCSAAILILSV
jgi:hypothetical protein